MADVFRPAVVAARLAVVGDLDAGLGDEDPPTYAGVLFDSTPDDDAPAHQAEAEGRKTRAEGRVEYVCGSSRRVRASDRSGDGLPSPLLPAH
ncbi:hypothetical protein ABZX93_29695 [Streptomyces sp. NPDC006632]|uniref:hypothetical protein n=1 Tax=Streptomyces sp. NPDC006632 TaxID=3157182 RepID=UPI0033A54F0A